MTLKIILNIKTFLILPTRLVQYATYQSIINVIDLLKNFVILSMQAKFNNIINYKKQLQLASLILIKYCMGGIGASSAQLSRQCLVTARLSNPMSSSPTFIKCLINSGYGVTLSFLSSQASFNCIRIHFHCANLPLKEYITSPLNIY